MHIDCGRMGVLDGVFIADDSAVQILLSKQKSIYFGEVLGKHSNINVILKEENIKLVTNDPTVVELFETHQLQSGFNPFHYIEEDEAEEELLDNWT